MRVLVTSGPTVEPIDEVRCITNFSSGKTGCAIALSFAERGHEVVFISGPARIPTHEKIQVVHIHTAVQLQKAVDEHFEACDALIMAAAVCDYRPEEKVKGKIPRKQGSFELKLVANPDILAEFGARKGNRVVIGFALEHDAGVESARKKCARKNCDIICLNSTHVLELDDTEITLIYSDGRVVPLPTMPKTEAAELIAETVEALNRERA
jgi:phosphopantothenoylcysteine decarboxylase / phosphopantothenate---cysteine ligase